MRHPMPKRYCYRPKPNQTERMVVTGSQHWILLYKVHFLTFRAIARLTVCLSWNAVLNWLALLSGPTVPDDLTQSHALYAIHVQLPVDSNTGDWCYQFFTPPSLEPVVSLFIIVSSMLYLVLLPLFMVILHLPISMAITANGSMFTVPLYRKVVRCTDIKCLCSSI